MYEDQVLNYLQQINNKLGSIDHNILEIKTSNDRILYQQQLMNSGDMIRNEEIKTTNSNTLLIAVILMTSLLFTFIIRSLK